jgi:hypothetical protein
MQLKHYIILLIAAVLEVSGDAIVRSGLPRWHSGSKILGALIVVLGIAVLGIYGVFVNKAPLDFSTTLGLYVAFFAVVGCIVGGFRDRAVNMSTVFGVVVIIVGGIIINHGARAPR